MLLSALQSLVEQAMAMRTLCKLAEEHAGDTNQLLRLALRARQTRHHMNTARAACGPTPPEGQDVGPAMIALQNAIKDSEAGDKILRSIERPEHSHPIELAASEDTVLHYLDMRIPESWDYSEGVVVILGSGLTLAEQALTAHGQARIIRADAGDSDKVYTKIRLYQPRAPKDVLVLTADNRISSDMKNRLDDAVRDCRVFLNTVRTFADTWVSQGLENMKFLGKASPIYQLGGQFAGGPAIIVAPGPSLDKNIAALKQFKGKSLIVATSHTLRAMHEADVYPDIVVAVDASDLLYHFEGCDLSRVGALAAGITCNPAIWQLPIKRKFFMGANATADGWLLDKMAPRAMMPSGGSVATTILAIMLHAGCDPIIAVGLDNSFPGGRYYASGGHDDSVNVEVEDGKIKVKGWSDSARDSLMGKSDDERDRRENAEQPLFELPAYDGNGTVQTSFILKMFHSWFEATARQCRAKCRFINATEGGARMDAWEQMPLQQVYDTIAHKFSIDMDKCLDASISDDKQARKSRAKTVKDMRNLIRASIPRNLKVIDRMIHALDTGDDNALDSAEQSLLQSVQKTSYLPLLVQNVLHTAYDRADGAISSYGTKLATKELISWLKTALVKSSHWV